MKSREEYIMLDSENIVENHIINQNNNNQIYCV